MLRLAYLVVLYWRYGGNLSTLSEELTADSSDQNDTATFPADTDSEGNAISEKSCVTSAPASGSSSWGRPLKDPSWGRPRWEDKPRRQSTSSNTTIAERGGQCSTDYAQGASGDGTSDDELQRLLKRVSIVDRLTVLTVLTSIVSDLDLLADWYFFAEGLRGESPLISDVALAFTVIGTAIYVLLAVEFHFVSKARAWWMGKPLSPLQHIPLGWQLFINVAVEDIPQLIITCITSPTSAAGVLNVATAGFALMAKMAEGFATRNDLPMSSQLRMVEEDPGVVRHILVTRRNAEKLAEHAASLAVLANEYRNGSDSDRRKEMRARRGEAVIFHGRERLRLEAVAFRVMQLDPGFLNGKLKYIRERLEVDCLELPSYPLKGMIPPEMGRLTALVRLCLQKNQLSGTIPSELGGLTALQNLDLSYNHLSGRIPSELGGLTALEVLDLSGNQLAGPIPPALGQLMALEELDLSTNGLDGSIPRELRHLKALNIASFKHNNFSGTNKVEIKRLLPDRCNVVL